MRKIVSRLSVCLIALLIVTCVSVPHKAYSQDTLEEKKKFLEEWLKEQKNKKEDSTTVPAPLEDQGGGASEIDTNKDEKIVWINKNGDTKSITLSKQDPKKVRFATYLNGKKGVAISWSVTASIGAKVSLEISKIDIRGKRGRAASLAVKNKRYSFPTYVSGYKKPKKQVYIKSPTVASGFAHTGGCVPPTVDEFFADLPQTAKEKAIEILMDSNPGMSIQEIIELIACGSTSTDNGPSSDNQTDGSDDTNLNGTVEQGSEGSVYGSALIPIDACASRRIRYEVSLVVDLSEVEENGDSPMTVSVQVDFNRSTRRIPRAKIKAVSESTGKSIVLYESLGRGMEQVWSWVWNRKGLKVDFRRGVERYWYGWGTLHGIVTIEDILDGRKATFAITDSTSTATKQYVCFKRAKKTQNRSGPWST